MQNPYENMSIKELKFYKDIENGLKEVKLIEAGKIKGKSLKELLHEQ
jgi:hypothetical protein